MALFMAISVLSGHWHPQCFLSLVPTQVANNYSGQDSSTHRPLSHVVAYLSFICICVIRHTYWPYFGLNIVLNFAHDSEGRKAYQLV